MPTISACPSCDKKLKTPDGAEGRKLRCPGCQAALIITEDGLAPAEGAARPRKGRPAPRDEDEEEAPRRSRRRDDDDEYDDDEAPRRRSRKKGGIPMWVWLAGGGVLAAGLIVLVLVLVLGGGNKFNKIKEGMTAKEVTDILGEPTTGDTKMLGVWYYPPLKKGEEMSAKALNVKEVMTIVFKDGKVKDIKRLSIEEMKKGLMK